ncbi:MAG: hypothetical protein Q4B82_00165 [Alysiella sp.]|uniref:hypothetical protein n=1 Tax=Alysiella sp. TaxID=1872483 RepID=UPI0026DACBDB|nr:hypothetical protein [Alysiella sp.]MDO4432982.1 hypothetical protein [Alysiella sp.]
MIETFLVVKNAINKKLLLYTAKLLDWQGFQARKCKLLFFCLTGIKWVFRQLFKAAWGMIRLPETTFYNLKMKKALRRCPYPYVWLSLLPCIAFSLMRLYFE